MLGATCAVMVSLLVGAASANASISIAQTTPDPVTEGNSGTTQVTYTITRNAGILSGPASVHVQTAAGTATSGADYQPLNQTVGFGSAPLGGVQSATVQVNVVGDTLNETNETFAVGLSNESGDSVGTRTVTTTIANDDPLPALSVTHASVAEGTRPNGPNTVLHIPVTLSAASGRQVTVHYAVTAGTATAGQDFIAGSGTLTFPAGSTSQTIDVPVVPDSLDEADETVVATIDAPTNATISASNDISTIVDDDPPPSVSVADASVPEGTGGPSTILHIPVTLSAASGRQVTVLYAVAAGTATPNQDFTPVSGTLTFAPGETSKTIDVSIVPDDVDEPNKTVIATIGVPTNATIGTSTATGTIVDDDHPTIVIDTVSRAEGNGGLTAFDFPVRLSNSSERTITVDWTTADLQPPLPGGAQPAVAGTDYDAASGTVTFAPGSVSQTVTVQVHGNTTIEPTKRFAVVLSNPTIATIDPAHQSAFGNILDDDTPNPPGGGGTNPPPTTTPPTTTPPTTKPPTTKPPTTKPPTKTDRTRPTVKLTRPKGHHVRVLSGTASDKGSGVAYVQVGIVYLDQQGCHYLATAKKFKKGSCTIRHPVKAVGTKRWHLKLPISVRGPMAIFARAVDKAGNLSAVRLIKLTVL
jgi:hypothetical protein